MAEQVNIDLFQGAKPLFPLSLLGTPWLDKRISHIPIVPSNRGGHNTIPLARSEASYLIGLLIFRLDPDNMEFGLILQPTNEMRELPRSVDHGKPQTAAIAAFTMSLDTCDRAKQATAYSSEMEALLIPEVHEIPVLPKQLQRAIEKTIDRNSDR